MPPAAMELAPAKVNLHLHVTGRRADGYHLLDSLVVFAGVADRLWVEAADGFALRLTGPFAPELEAEQDNLVLRAGRLLADAAGITPHGALTLEKILPVASGIGGGSADAAAALRLLQRFWQVSLPPDTLATLCRQLGADVPVCYGVRPAMMRGIGEILTPVAGLPEAGLVLVNPGVGVSTPSVFKARTGAFSAPADSLEAGWPDSASMAAALRALGNDLQPPAITLAPVIAEVLSSIEALPGCLLARMSGSGATCFGLFESPTAAIQAAEGLQHPGWWRWGGGFFDSARF